MGVIQITLRLSGTRKMLLVPPTCRIPELFAKVREAIGDRTADFYLICDGEQLEETNEETIEAFGISHGSVVDFCQRQRGGSGRLQPLPGKIGLSRDPCCITYDDDPSTYRAEMPCRCVISVDAMKYHTEEELRKGRHRIQCPNCRQNWSLHLVRHVLSSVMSAAQLEEIGAKVNDNYLKNSAVVQQCPSCNNFCEHTDRDQNRIRCRFCSMKLGGEEEFVFCWACLKPWQKARSFTCGNPGCTGKDARTRYLQECTTKTIGQVSGVPSVRRCDKCNQLVHHIDACKHMTCKCGFNFCFVCLKPQIKGQWQCGSYNSVCEVAPRQT